MAVKLNQPKFNFIDYNDLLDIIERKSNELTFFDFPADVLNASYFKINTAIFYPSDMRPEALLSKLNDLERITNLCYTALPFSVREICGYYISEQFTENVDRWQNIIYNIINFVNNFEALPDFQTSVLTDINGDPILDIDNENIYTVEVI